MTKAFNAIPWSRFFLMGLVALLLASRMLFQRDIFTDWGPWDLLQAIFLSFIDNFIVCSALTCAAVFSLRLKIRPVAARWTLVLLALLSASFLANLFLGLRDALTWAFPPWPYVVGESLRWGVCAAFLLGVDRMHMRVLRSQAAASDLEVSKSILMRELSESRLRMLEAQIEPHFLFNTLANLKSVYRLDREKGNVALANLLSYLKLALPQFRRSESTVEAETELVRAYLELFSMRMGKRLQFEINLPTLLYKAPFPPLMLLTLVENAIKHGLMPSPLGGTVRIVGTIRKENFAISILDDGVGLGGAVTSGSGLGLANIKARLKEVYGKRASLIIEPNSPHGVSASILIPLPSNLVGLGVNSETDDRSTGVSA